MPGRPYGQFCGLATALELVGERWALLVVRELILGGKRFTELRRALPRIPTNILAARLRELERSGLVRRQASERPGGGVVYELTPYGKDLKPIILTLGAWGARTLAAPSPDDIVTPDALVLALEATFQPDAAEAIDASFEVRVGPVTVHARVRDGRLAAATGPLGGADLTIVAGPQFKSLLSGDLTPEDALAGGVVRITGEPALLRTFTTLFRIAAAPEGMPGRERSSAGEEPGRIVR